MPEKFFPKNHPNLLIPNANVMRGLFELRKQVIKKTTHYFIVVEIPTVPIEQILYAIEALLGQSLKMAEIYASLFRF